MTAFADCVILSSSSQPDPQTPGRQIRVFAQLVRCSGPHTPFGVPPAEAVPQYQLMLSNEAVLPFNERPTYAQALAAVAATPEAAETFARLPLRVSGSTAPQVHTLAEVIDQQAKSPSWGNPSLAVALQDLAEEIMIDVHEACAAFADPDLFYPGVDDGIEPVSDEHVALVIAAMQRELNRETRDIHGVNYGAKIPAAPLALLPWRVQRALAERRRLRYQQWGIGRKEWESGMWSLWNVPEDADWLPRQVTDGRTAFGAAV